MNLKILKLKTMKLKMILKYLIHHYRLETLKNEINFYLKSISLIIRIL